MLISGSPVSRNGGRRAQHVVPTFITLVCSALRQLGDQVAEENAIPAKADRPGTENPRIPQQSSSISSRR
ncbi:hypothetical protein AOLI_G00014570 [Acnodon oligacanthus]